MFKPSADIETLRQRAAVLAKLRRFFDERDFFEVDTPSLSSDSVVDRYLNPIPVAKQGLDIVTENQAEYFWLQTSPEFAMKRLVAAGAKAIYQITHAFRSGEMGRLHNPEFTMLEWYRIGDTQDSAMRLLGELAITLLNRSSFQCITYQAAFEKHTGLNPHNTTPVQLKQTAKQHGIDIRSFQEETDLDFWRNLLLTQVVEPHLGTDQPIIVYDWPASQAALAIVRQGYPPLAERFELFVNGIELANGYHELRDPTELRTRNEKINQLRQRDGQTSLPAESRLLAAMESGLPACCGVALGVDRLVMLALKKTSLREVMTFPIDIA